MFRTESGIPVTGISCSDLLKLRGLASSEFAITAAQVAEAAAYSFAMVIRYALGLSSANARIAALCTDSLQGAIALATLRQLKNGGASGLVIELGEEHALSADYGLQRTQMERLGTEFKRWRSAKENDQFVPLLASCHNILIGAFDPLTQSDPPAEQLLDNAVEVLNEQAIPAHAIECPPGLNGDTGERSGTPLFASSTLSLGIPLTGLFAGRDYVGRHYLCDTSVPAPLYRMFGLQNETLFAEQPILRIFPVEDAQQDQPKGS